jgi:predicted nucleotidyltransferase
MTLANLAFPLCREPAHEERIRQVLEACVAFITQRVPRPRLVGIVLMGSFARGEGTVLPVGRHLRVLGDIELFVLLATEVDYRRLRRQFAQWSREASATIGASDVRVELEFGPVEVRYLERAAPSIFVHDLRTHGKVLWGPPDVLDAVAPFGADAIPPEDALNLLFNRTVEQLEAYDRVETLHDDGLLAAAYQRLKLLLDIAGSALAFAGTHESSYGRRPGAFANLLAETPSLARLLPRGFDGAVAAAARAKLTPEEGQLLATVAGAPAKEIRAWIQHEIRAAIPATTAVLRWELGQLVGVQGDLPSLLGRYLPAPALGRRIWEWAKLALNTLPAPVPVSPLRGARLFWASTPRVLLYAAATLAYLDLIEPNAHARTITTLLPMGRRRVPTTDDEQRKTIVALWRWCVRNS